MNNNNHHQHITQQPHHPLLRSSPSSSSGLSPASLGRGPVLPQSSAAVAVFAYPQERSSPPPSLLHEKSTCDVGRCPESPGGGPEPSHPCFHQETESRGSSSAVTPTLCYSPTSSSHLITTHDGGVMGRASLCCSNNNRVDALVPSSCGSRAGGAAERQPAPAEAGGGMTSPCASPRSRTAHCPVPQDGTHRRSHRHNNKNGFENDADAESPPLPSVAAYRRQHPSETVLESLTEVTTAASLIGSAGSLGSCLSESHYSAHHAPGRDSSGSRGACQDDTQQTTQDDEEEDVTTASFPRDDGCSCFEDLLKSSRKHGGAPPRLACRRDSSSTQTDNDNKDYEDDDPGRLCLSELRKSQSSPALCRDDSAFFSSAVGDDMVFISAWEFLDP